MILTWILIIAMIALNALYVAAEFAAVSVRHSRIRSLADAGNALALRLLPRIDGAAELDRYVACCQVGITFSSLLLGAVGQAALTLQLAPLLELWFSIGPAAALSTSAIVVLLCLTAAQMVLGELVPKSLALQFPTQIALMTVIPMNWSQNVFSWFIAALNGSGSLLLRLCGVRGSGHRHIHSPEEIELLIVDSRDGGLLEPEEQHRLHQALRLSQRPASQLMVPRNEMVTIDVNSPPSLVLKHVAESPYSRFPVVRGPNHQVIGLLYTKDVIARYLEGRLPSVDRTMRPVLTLSSELTADRLLALFRERRCQQAILVDASGNVEGLVTLEDVLTEVFGDLDDELKPTNREPEVLPDGRVRAPGETSLEELQALLDGKLASHTGTIGELVLNRIGRRPKVGDRIAVDDVEIIVVAMKDRAIASVTLRPSIASAGEEGEQS